MTATFRLTDRQRAANKLLGRGQRHTMLAGGSRSGKTFLLTRAVIVRALKAAASRHAILRFRANAIRASIVLDTFPAVIRACWPELAPHITHHQRDGYIEMPNGSQIWYGGLDDKERVEKILGQEYATLYLNECSQIPYSSVLVALTRLAQKTTLTQKALYDLNSSGTGHWTYRLFIEGKQPQSKEALPDAEDYAHMFVNPADNADNLDPAYLRSLDALPEKQRKRFRDGRYVAEVDGALWTLDAIEGSRIDKAPDLRRIVVAVDPSGASGPEDYRSDEIGISVCGIGHDGKGYVLADRTMRGSPSQWARAAAAAFDEYQADTVIAEKNFGGAMVENTLKSVRATLPVKLITASRGKTVRAEPISALYDETQEGGSKVHHVGRLPDLEDQLCNFSTAGYMGGTSPDRADAMVWALTELMVIEDTTSFTTPMPAAI